MQIMQIDFPKQRGGNDEATTDPLARISPEDFAFKLWGYCVIFKSIHVSFPDF